MNNQERNKFKADYERKFYTCPRGYIVETGEYTNHHAASAWWAFQAGAAHQREQVKGLVDALEKISALTTHSAIQHWADEALAAYRAAQEGK